MSVLLHFVRWQLGLARPEVWTTPAERECLARYAAGKRRLVEVGVWHAGTACCLRSAMHPDGTLFAVDPYPKGRLGFSIPRVIGRRELGRISKGRVVWLRQAGVDAAGTDIIREQPLDFVFIDAAQTYETLRAEWAAWSPLVNYSGVVALHDTRTPSGSEAGVQGSVRYMRDVISLDRRFEKVDGVDSLTILRRLPR